MPSVPEKIQNGDYTFQHVYSPEGATQEQRTATRLENFRLEREMTAKFRADLEAEEGTDKLPEAVRDRVWELAWAEGHSAGYYEVYGCYDDYGDLAKLAFEAGKRA